MIIALVTLALTGQTAIYGTALARDGDSLSIGQRQVRLFGIDAPEFDQVCQLNGRTWACGKAAADRLASLVSGRDVRCDPISEDQFGRHLAKCFVGAQEINSAMVKAGYAVAFRRYSLKYVSAEESAKAQKRGIWASTFTMPNDARAATRSYPAPRTGKTNQSPARQRTSGRGCVIKGNQSRRGEWIYHLPGMPYYEQTRPEAIFCSEAEAQAAGYRRALVR